MSSCVDKRLGSKVKALLCEQSDDYVLSSFKLSELYDNVPEDIKDVMVSVFELHFIEPGKRAKVKKWLYRDSN